MLLTLGNTGALMGIDSTAVRKAAQTLAKQDNCDVLIFNGPCYPQLSAIALPKIRARQENAKRPKKAVWLITTPGGIPEVAYRMSRSIQATYEETTALIGGWCKSAGTLCVISANELVMSDDAELGPLDIQLARRDEINERDSGLVIDEALDCLEEHAFAFFDAFMRQIKDKTNGLVTLRMASEISANITKGLFEPIYRQIDPQKIGEIARSMAVGRAYALRLNMRSKNLKPNALDNLLMGYPSHGFVIDRDEAGFLFKSVRKPTDVESQLLKNLGKVALIPEQQPYFELVTPEASNEDPTSNPAKQATTKAAAPKPKTVATPRVRRGSNLDGGAAKDGKTKSPTPSKSA